MATGRESNLRVGTNDREAAVSALGTHLTEGRLDITEYTTRCEAATTATTRGDLSDLFEDLPAPHPVFGPKAAPKPEVTRTPDDNPLIEKTDPRRTKILVLSILGVAVAAVITVAAVTSTWWAVAPILLLGFVFIFAS
ncbi:DUF1707 SHOCT-like domain-containing protein [Actinokineospora sp. G85]|uniref:DUF1707 SHOCT-like domain-containing protein n=1 Tax=Actinokineospora sp. G85 TaxID=3406626 RepID=UPI003C708105